MDITKDQCQCCGMEFKPGVMSLVDGKNLCFHCEIVMFIRGPDCFDRQTRTQESAEEDFLKCLEKIRE